MTRRDERMEHEILSIDVMPPSPDERCIRCGVLIDDTNESGWEGFTADGFTQKICIICNTNETISKQGA
jgi:hypothetical protein